VETGVFLHTGPVGGPERGCCFTGEFERKVRFLFMLIPCLLVNPRDVKISALEKGNSLLTGPVGEPKAGSVNRGLGDTVKECYVNGVSLSLGAV
jgi:hypothetical protein